MLYKNKMMTVLENTGIPKADAEVLFGTLGFNERPREFKDTFWMGQDDPKVNLPFVYHGDVLTLRLNWVGLIETAHCLGIPTDGILDQHQLRSGIEQRLKRKGGKEVLGCKELLVFVLPPRSF